MTVGREDAPRLFAGAGTWKLTGLSRLAPACLASTLHGRASSICEPPSAWHRHLRGSAASCTAHGSRRVQRKQFAGIHIEVRHLGRRREKRSTIWDEFGASVHNARVGIHLHPCTGARLLRSSHPLNSMAARPLPRQPSAPSRGSMVAWILSCAPPLQRKEAAMVSLFTPLVVEPTKRPHIPRGRPCLPR